MTQAGFPGRVLDLLLFIFHFSKAGSSEKLDLYYLACYIAALFFSFFRRCTFFSFLACLHLLFSFFVQSPNLEVPNCEGRGTRRRRKDSKFRRGLFDLLVNLSCITASLFFSVRFFFWNMDGAPFLRKETALFVPF